GWATVSVSAAQSGQVCYMGSSLTFGARWPTRPPLPPSARSPLLWSVCGTDSAKSPGTKPDVRGWDRGTEGGGGWAGDWEGVGGGFRAVAVLGTREPKRGT
ncbi:hypothetical protein KI387_019319, partial [Taxus chinensis]